MLFHFIQVDLSARRTGVPQWVRHRTTNDAPASRPGHRFCIAALPPSRLLRYHTSMNKATVSCGQTGQISDESMRRLFGTSRLSSFYDAGGNRERALEAYAWQLGLGQALLKPIGIGEVFLRNTMDDAICQWWQEQHLPGDWLDIGNEEVIPEPLHSFSHVSQWRSRAAKNLKSHKTRTQIDHDDVIAHTMLGTWRNMIGNPTVINIRPPDDEQRRRSWSSLRIADTRCAALWREIIRHAFPNMPTKRGRDGLSPRAYIGSKVASMSSLRNRVCHWDNLMHVNVSARYADMLSVVAAIDTTGYAWMKTQTQDEVTQILSERPHRLNELIPL